MSKPANFYEALLSIGVSAAFCIAILLFVIGFAAYCAGGWLASAITLAVVCTVLVGGVLLWWFR
ncbi:MAG: hypothetical protein JST01_28700 [Cyanobacteria bacterium SZAS TMP-1]|nr:hypothetical protein [Cyanobacteria bacterium SZAS TMP-1]